MTKPGLDYDPDDLFTPVASHNAVRMLIASSTELDWELVHLDFSNAYLHGELLSPVYMRQPTGPHGHRMPGSICKLIKSIYGLRQAGIIWHRVLEDALIRFGFLRIECELAYVLHTLEHHAVIVLIVDDVMLGSLSKATVQAILSYLHAHFTVKDLGPVERFIGWNISRNRIERTTFVNQSHYTEELLRKYAAHYMSPAPTPVSGRAEKGRNDDDDRLLPWPTPHRAAVGAVMYLAVSTRPDISHSVTMLATNMGSPTDADMRNVKRLWRYLIATTDYGIRY
jgi:hypothetical protein